ncbi:electron transfer flavoprotein subunit alpha/FixB family protein [Opitutus terrae]|uniref:Electron transfer flavoprotein alpha subunit-like protein n=1 Tax=Opitutus terrae (strain DSM 11246 / JCM 15787 / PB90-1) TaxID=452637 RepID=B1ZZ91_OPITP|nr:electron transfer flavoprotein subunit alpha [Opitutus terrae]ACB77163.1 electron transfer flavoprotein alpha subunit-like protein [Opitutus terrae PB90-1]
METLLFLAHTEPDGSLAKPALETLTSAKSLAASLSATFVAGLVGGEVQPAANQIAACGATRLLGVAGPEFAASRYATDIVAIEALAKSANATLVVAPATSRWNRVLAGAAQRLGGRIDAHVTGAAVTEGKLNLTRWYYRQRMEAVVQRTRRPWFILLESGCAEPWQGAAGTATVEAVAVPLTPAQQHTAVVGVQAPAADAQTIRPDAQLLFVAGAGWTKKQSDGQPHVPEAEKLILDFLGKTKASLGSTKSLVDLSGEGQAVLPFMSHLNQVGQTGSTPRHPKGLATCCHGEEPHTVGWRFINERRAINLNPSCSWAQGKADVLYVADAFAVMRKVNELLAARS